MVSKQKYFIFSFDLVHKCREKYDKRFEKSETWDILQRKHLSYDITVLFNSRFFN